MFYNCPKISGHLFIFDNYVISLETEKNSQTSIFILLFHFVSVINDLTIRGLIYVNDQ